MIRIRMTTLYFAVFSIKKVLIIIIHRHNQECQAVIIQTSQFKGLILLLPNAQHNLDASFHRQLVLIYKLILTNRRLRHSL